MDKSKKTKKEVFVNFVIPDGCESEDEVNDLMKAAYQDCLEADIGPKWVTEEACLKMVASKNTVFVLQEFSGELFKKLRTTKSVLVGPMCMRSCIADGLPIPDNNQPIFTTAMRNLVVTASQVSVPVKKEIKEKVGFMGGVYVNNLVGPVTHLVTNAVRSSKYEAASQKGIPVMVVGWIDSVWTRSQTQNIRATDPDMLAQYKCPIFLNMSITCSNLTRAEKEQIKNLVTANGGSYTPQMRQRETTLLVIKEPRGEKYNHARSWGLPCVRPSYILDSVKAGYALPSEAHLVAPTVSASTPTKGEDLPNFTCTSDASISVINFESSKMSVDDTQMTSCSVTSQRRAPTQTPANQYVQTLSNLTVSDAKKAGSFMDGCKIYLSGFSAAESEKLTRLLSLGGATLFPELCDSVSHILVGEFSSHDMKALVTMAQRPHVVSLDWLVASIQHRGPAPEEPYTCLETKRVVPEPPSPLSQKGMQLLQPPPPELNETHKMPPPPEPACRKLFTEFINENVEQEEPPAPLNQSVTAPEPEPDPPQPAGADTNETSLSTVASQTFTTFFEGLKFLIVGFDSNLIEDIESAIEEAGGRVVAVNFSGVADYALVPLQTSAVPNITAVEVVTNLWLEDCLDNGRVVDVQYYHQPLSLDTDRTPLSGCCVSLSSYFNKEKTFLAELVQRLGATYQDVLARVAKQNKGVLPSSHLICPKPEGQKYKAAVLWGVPAVTREWLLACARQAVRLPETPYLVNATLADSGHVSATTSKTNAVTPSTSTSTTTPAPASLLVTPVHRAVTSLKRKSSALTPDDNSPFHVSTPDTPYGQVFQTPTDTSKKRWKRFIDTFPSKPPTPPKPNPKRYSTPVSEIKRQIWKNALGEMSDENINPNYSIEEMDGNQENEGQMESISERISSKDDSTTPARNTASVNTSESYAKSSQSRRIGSGRSTPSSSDFTGESRMSSRLELSKTGSSRETPSSAAKPAETSKRSPKKSPENDRVCEMLEQMHRRMSITNSGREDPQPLPQRELVSPPDTVPATQKPVVSSLLPESQPILIGWDDPVESAERAKVMGTTSPVTTSSSFVSKRPRKFVLSNVTEKEVYEARVAALGETVLSTTMYDSDTTHLVMDEPLRSEKLLCCLAAGKWVLHTSYIDAMVANNGYLPEEEKYEWGNPLSAANLPSLAPGSLEHQLACAAVKWRKQLSGGSAGAFTGMRAIIVSSAAKYESYKRLVLAGGGEIVTPTSVGEPTHCFVDASKLSQMPVPLERLAAQRVPCLPPVFLGDTLTKFPPPGVHESVLPDYRKLL